MHAACRTHYAVMLREERSLALRSAGMMGDAEVTVVWRERKETTTPTRYIHLRSAARAGT